MGHIRVNEGRLLFFAVFFICIFVSPLFLLGEDAHIRVHDNLDSNIAWYNVLKRSGELFGPVDATIAQVINGLPRYAYGSEWSGIVFINALFPPMVAYAINQFITRLVAFTGMYLLLKSYVVPEKDTFPIRVLCALAFCLTPFWPSGMLSTLGHPLALWAFLKIREGKGKLVHWLTICLLPFYASIVLGFFFFLVAIGLLWLSDVIKNRKWNPPFFASIALMAGIFLLVEYRLVYQLLFGQESSHRVEFVSSRHDFFRSLRLSVKNFFLGHTHVMTLHTAVILPILFLVLGFILYRREWKREKLFLFLFLFNYALSLWYALWFNNMWIPLKERIELLNTFNFARFHFLRPTVIYVSFALACRYLWNRNWKNTVIFALMAQILVLLPFNEEIHYRFIHHAPSFKQFYAEEQFADIAEWIGRPKSSYRVASIGLHPAIAQYNGFYTLDTYNNFYPLTYKYQFRKIIEKELEKNKSLKTYFDEWGSRCYVFVDELGKKYDYRKNTKKKIEHLQLNTEVFYEMGGRYFFSSVPIVNARENQLHLLQTFDHPDSAWRIYLYEVRLQKTAMESG